MLSIVLCGRDMPSLIALQGRIQDFLIGGEPNNLGYRGRGTNERSEL